MLDILGHPSFDGMVISKSFIHPNFQFLPSSFEFVGLKVISLKVFGFEVAEGTDYESIVRELVLKSHFLDIDDNEIQNVNKRGRRMNKHVELWAKNAFDEWKESVSWL